MLFVRFANTLNHQCHLKRPLIALQLISSDRTLLVVFIDFEYFNVNFVNSETGHGFCGRFLADS